MSAKTPKFKDEYKKSKIIKVRFQTTGEFLPVAPEQLIRSYETGRLPDYIAKAVFVEGTFDLKEPIEDEKDAPEAIGADLTKVIEENDPTKDDKEKNASDASSTSSTGKKPKK